MGLVVVVWGFFGCVVGGVGLGGGGWGGGGGGGGKILLVLDKWDIG